LAIEPLLSAEINGNTKIRHFLECVRTLADYQWCSACSTSLGQRIGTQNLYIEQRRTRK